jgi:hypothetical protein
MLLSYHDRSVWCSLVSLSSAVWGWSYEEWRGWLSANYPVWERHWLFSFSSESGAARNKSESRGVFDAANPRITDDKYTDATRPLTICSTNKMPMTLTGNISFVYNCTASHIISSTSAEVNLFSTIPEYQLFGSPVWHIILGSCESQCFGVMGRRKG